jgi:hypothetical protein
VLCFDQFDGGSPAVAEDQLIVAVAHGTNEERRRLAARSKVVGEIVDAGVRALTQAKGVGLSDEPDRNVLGVGVVAGSWNWSSSEVSHAERAEYGSCRE